MPTVDLSTRSWTDCPSDRRINRDSKTETLPEENDQTPQNLLARLGNLKFVEKLEQNELTPARVLFIKLNSERRLAVGDESFLEEENGKRFLEAILQGPTQHSVKLSALLLDSQIIALCLRLAADGR